MFDKKIKEGSTEVFPGRKKLPVSTLVYAFLIFAVVLVAAMSILAYGTNTQIGNKIANVIGKTIPFPAVIIGYTHVIEIGQVEDNLASVQRFYESQDFSKSGLRVDFTTPDGQKRLKIKEREVLNKMVEDKVVEILSKQHGITISPSEVDKAVAKQLADYGSTTDTVSAKLKEMYGWTIDDFKNKVVLPSMYRDALSTAVAGELKSPQQAKEKIESAKQALDSGTDFTAVAQKYSQGASAQNGGEMGWVSRDQLIPALSAAIYGGSNISNEIIESPLGFHLIDVEEKKKDGNADVVRFKQVFVPKETFADWLNIQMGKMSFMVPLNGYYWDRSSNTVEFKDDQMRKFEQQTKDDSSGDASMMF